MGAVDKSRGGVAPSPAAVGGGVTQQGRAVVDLDGTICFRRSSQRYFVRVYDHIANDRGREGRHRIDGHAQRARGNAGVAGRIGGGRGQAVGAVRQRSSSIGPGARAVGQGGTQQRGAVIDLNRAVGFRRAGQGRRAVVGDVIANGAAVGRERGDGRGNRGHRIDGHAQRRRGNAGVAGHIGGGRGQIMGAVDKSRGGVAPSPAAVGGGVTQQGRAVVDLDRAVGFRRAGQGRRAVVGDVIANGAAVGRERGDGRGNRGHRIDGHAQRRRGNAGVAGRIGGGGSQIMGAVAQRRRGVAPGAAAVGSGAAQQRGAVIDLNRAVGFRRAGQGRRAVVGDVIANGAAVGRERGDGRGNRGHRIDGHAQRRRGNAGVAGHIGGGRGQIMGAVDKSRGGVAPSPAAVGGGVTQQGRAVVDLDRAVGFRRAGQGRRAVVGDVIANGAAVGRERGDGRGNRGHRIDGHAQRARGRAGVAGRIGGGRSQVVGAVRQRSSSIGPGARAVGQGGTQQRGAVIDLDRAVGFRRAGQGRRAVVGDVIANGAAVGRERGD